MQHLVSWRVTKVGTILGALVSDWYVWNELKLTDVGNKKLKRLVGCEVSQAIEGERGV